MPLENKLGLTDEAALARAEEKISKTKALELYDTGLLTPFRWEHLKDWRISTGICLRISISLPGRCAP